MFSWDELISIKFMYGLVIKAISTITFQSIPTNSKFTDFVPEL